MSDALAIYEQEPIPRWRILIGVGPAMVVPLIAAWFYFVLFSGSKVASVLYVTTKVFTLFWPLLAVKWIERRCLRFQIQGTVYVGRSVWAGLWTGGLIVAAVVVAYDLTPLGAYVRHFAEPIRRKISDFGIFDHYWLFAAFLAIGHSLIEEYYWRWFVFGRLSEIVPLPWAHLLAASSFAAHHFVVLGSFFSPIGALVFGTFVGIGGALWSWLYRRHGSLLGPWISHVLADSAILWIGYRLISG